jgi:TPR repeat protein
MRISKLLVPLAFLMLFSNGVAAAAPAGFGDFTDAQFKEILAKAIPMAEQGDAEAQFALGFLYSEGLGVLENDRTGAKWLTLAAKQGNALAQYLLALKFDKGEGVLENSRTSRLYAEAAAIQGQGDAQRFLGILYALDKDYIRGYMWFTLAIYNNAEIDVTVAKDTTEGLMERGAIDKAQQMASRCLESEYTDCGILPVLEYD